MAEIDNKIPLIVLGATGMVGQRALMLLQNHPWFEVAGLAASPRSAGKRYHQACTWRLEGSRYAGFGDMMVHTCDPASFASLTPKGIALSALDSDTAKTVEPAFAEAGWLVVSNAGAHRMQADVPLVIPEVNPDHLSLLAQQQTAGKILTNPNCTSIPLVITLAALRQKATIEAVFLSSYQAVSGAGYPGESAWDMIGNVHPHPGNEEEKVGEEPLKMLGQANQAANFPISARCVRVPVVDGHLIAVGVRTNPALSPQEAQTLFQEFQGNLDFDLPTAPKPLIEVAPERNRPVPRLDSDNGNGMAVTVGRIEACPVFGLKYFALSHNTIRGAAGAAILNAELLVAKKLVGTN